MPVEKKMPADRPPLTEQQKRSLYTCLQNLEGQEDASIHQIANEIGLSTGHTHDLLKAAGAHCSFCVISCKGGKWSTLFSPEFWD